MYKIVSVKNKFTMEDKTQAIEDKYGTLYGDFYYKSMNDIGRYFLFIFTNEKGIRSSPIVTISEHGDYYSLGTENSYYEFEKV